MVSMRPLHLGHEVWWFSSISSEHPLHKQTCMHGWITRVDGLSMHTTHNWIVTSFSSDSFVLTIVRFGFFGTLRSTWSSRGTWSLCMSKVKIIGFGVGRHTRPSCMVKLKIIGSGVGWHTRPSKLFRYASSRARAVMRLFVTRRNVSWICWVIPRVVIWNILK